MLTDLAGDKQGVLSANAITDDNTPTFSGTGQPGATIQIKDSSGNTLASAMVSKDGTDGKTADPDRREHTGQSCRSTAVKRPPQAASP